MQEVFTSDPIVKIKADIMAAEHYVTVGRNDLADITLARIERQLPVLTNDQFIDVTTRLADANLIDADDEAMQWVAA